MRQYLSKILYLLGSGKRQLVFLLMGFGIVSLLEFVGIGVIAPYITLATKPEIILNRVQPLALLTQQLNWDTDDLIIGVGIIIIILFSLKSLIYWHVQTYIIEFSQMCRRNLGIRLFAAYVKAPYTFHLQRNSSQAIQAITQDTATYAGGILRPFLTLIINVMIIACLAALICLMNLTATIAIAGMILPLLILFKVFQKRLYAWGKTARDTNIETMRIVSQGMIGIKETQIIGCADYFIEHLDESIRENNAVITYIESFKITPRIIVEALLVLFTIGSVSIFVWRGGSAQDAFPLLGVLGLASVRLIPAITITLASASNLQNSRYQLDKVYQDLKEIETQLESPSQLIVPSVRSTQEPERMDFSQEITLSDIHFSYPEAETEAIAGISLRIRKGESVALIGKSGAGKTTLADIILGLLAPQSGDIRVDGVSVYRHLRAWQNLLGYIPQSIALNDDTIEGNIAFGVPVNQVDPDRLHKAIQDAQLESLVSQLAAGVKTPVGERGVRLSGGQRQRIGIARALYHERDILVLDEATSALDHETEALVTEAIKSLGVSKTLIIIAHRLTTVQHCDRLYQIDKGQIIQAGTYREVLGQGSLELA